MAILSKQDAAEPTDGESQAQGAYRRLEEMIVTLELAPGRELTETKLSVLLGFGRTPIREALQRLARDHLVVIMPRRGIRVTGVDVADQLLLLEMRRELERYVCRRAARLATADDKRQFAEMAVTMERAAADGDNITFLRIDKTFNRRLAECARNPFAEEALAPINSLSRRFWSIHYEKAADLPVAAKAHADIMRAIAAGDEVGAAAANDRLLEYVEDFTRAIRLDTS